MCRYRIAIILSIMIAMTAGSAGAVWALTPTQSTILANKARADAAAKAKTQAAINARTKAEAKAKVEATEKAKALAIGKLAVQRETKTRIEAARKAAEANIKITNVNRPIEVKGPANLAGKPQAIAGNKPAAIAGKVSAGGNAQLHARFPQSHAAAPSASTHNTGKH